jgi:hypothetical protein
LGGSTVVERWCRLRSMGKNGKHKRKRSRIEGQVTPGTRNGGAFACLQEDEHESENESDYESGSEHENESVHEKREKTIVSPTMNVTMQASSPSSSSDSASLVAKRDLDLAIQVLFALSRHIEMFKSKAFKSIRTEIFPLLELQKTAFFEPPSDNANNDADMKLLQDKRALNTLSKIVNQFTNRAAQGKQQFLSAESKLFRRAMHPLVIAQFNLDIKKLQADFADRSYSAQVSTAFRDKDWANVLKLLVEMRIKGEPPKLGALQRWVRDCDVAVIRQSGSVDNTNNVSNHDNNNGSNSGELDYESNLAWLLLDAVMRVFSHRTRTECNDTTETATSSTTNTRVVIHKHAPFVPSSHGYNIGALLNSMSALPSKEYILQNIHTVSHVPGPQRRPPSKYDLNIISNTRGLVDCSIDNSIYPVTRYDIPGVSGAFLMTNVFTPWACRQLINIAEAVGYVPDAVEGIDNVVWLAEEHLLEYVYSRVLPFLPPTIGNFNSNSNSKGTNNECEVRGINATWRLFRYYPGSVYRPHIDGAWPGSGIRKDTGEYAQDAFDGDRFSKLTFLVYLNDDFEGGETTFYLPTEGQIGHVDALSVRPTVGSVLCFPHGDAMGSLVHEGSEVVDNNNGVGQPRAAKYVIRSDVLYSVAR